MKQPRRRPRYDWFEALVITIFLTLVILAVSTGLYLID